MTHHDRQRRAATALRTQPEGEPVKRLTPVEVIDRATRYDGSTDAIIEALADNGSADKPFRRRTA